MADLAIDRWIKDLPRDFGEIAADVEANGADGLWTAESTHNALGMSYLAADHTEDIRIGTRISLAFVRSPMVTAYTAWDLAHYSEGRFALGLGTQVKAHNERRFGVDWESPGPRLREAIRAIRHIWRVWQGEEPELDFDGEYYQFSLMTDNFDPGPIDHPDVPIFVSALNSYNVHVAGEVCDGIHLHPFNSPEYLGEVMYPWLEEGAERGDRSVDDVTVSASPFIITGADDEAIAEKREAVRKRVAFYASTPSYRDVLEFHGWGDLGDGLHELSREGKWSEMAEHVPDEMLYDYAVEAHHDHVVDAVTDEYGDLADRIVLSTYGYPFGKTLAPA
jgi:probable F420-dependent oxidoreductase